MANLYTVIISFYSWGSYVLLGATYILLTSPILVYGLLTKREVMPSLRIGNAFFMATWLRILFFVKTSTFRLEDLKEARKKHKKLILLSNHSSLIDMVVLMPHISPFFGFSKNTFNKVPFMNVFMKLSGNIFIDNSNWVLMKEAFQAAKTRIENGETFFIFPEGTRVGRETLKKFKDGAFRLAVDTEATILPLAVSGTSDFLYDRKFWLASLPPYHFKIHVGRPIAFYEYNGNIDLAKQMAREQIENMFKEDMCKQSSRE